jgi:hypothetical protein
MEKNPKTNTRKTSQRGAAKKDATKAQSKKSPAQSLGMNQIMEKARELGLTVPVGISKTELIRSIQRAEGNFDCFGTAHGYCDQSTCYWWSLCVIKKR